MVFSYFPHTPFVMCFYKSALFSIQIFAVFYKIAQDYMTIITPDKLFMTEKTLEN